MRHLPLLFLCAASLVAVDYPPTTTLTVKALPNPIPALPGYLVPYTDPVHGTQVRRVSDATAMGVDLSAKLRITHMYAKNQPWNCDGTLLMLDYIYPCPVLDGNTYARLRQISQPSQAIWSHSDPLTTFGRNGNKVVSCNMSTGATTTLATLSAYSAISIGDGEGNLDNADKWMALYCTTTGGAKQVAIFDMTSKTITATLAVTSPTFNNCAMSQSGNFVVVQWGTSGSGSQQGIEIYNRSLVFQRQIHTSGGGHFDLGYDTSGNEVIVITNEANRALIMRRLDTGATTTLLGTTLMGYNIHVSCRNTNRPGWAVISEFTGNPDQHFAYTQDVFAVQLDPTATGNAPVQRFAQTYHSDDVLPAAYERQAHAAVSPDGSKVIFASDWRNSAAKVYAYVANAAPPANLAPTIGAAASASPATLTMP
jgi:hypothetical protein